MSGETGQKWDGNAHSSALLNVASNEGPALLRKQVLVRLVLGWQLVSKLNYRAVGRSETTYPPPSLFFKIFTLVS